MSSLTVRAGYRAHLWERKPNGGRVILNGVEQSRRAPRYHNGGFGFVRGDCCANNTGLAAEETIYGICAASPPNHDARTQSSRGAAAVEAS